MTTNLNIQKRDAPFPFFYQVFKDMKISITELGNEAWETC